MANTYLKRTLSGTPSVYTFSAWIKLGHIINGNNQYQSIFSNGAQQLLGLYGGGDTANHNALYHYNGSSIWYTNNLLRDPCAWYHVLLKVSSGTATTYINGVQTSYASSASLGALVTTADKLTVGCYAANTDSFFTGSMSHVHFCDGTAYNPTDFGSTDSTTGEWKINTSPNVNYGTDGFFILKDGNSVTDQSPNTNHFTVGGGTLTKTEDNPSNVFCNFNNLTPVPSASYSNGNTKAVDGAGAHKAFYGTLGFSSGKYYWEAKAVGGSKYTIGLSDVENYIYYTQVSNTNVIIGESSNSYNSGDAIGWYYNDINKNGSNIASGIHTIVTNDIIMVAADADNGKIYYGLNGTWRVANSTTFNAANNDTTFTTAKTYTPAFSGENCGWEVNWGNGYFGTSAVSSAGTNASNIGIFEYDVPSGFTALSTKGLNE